MDSKTQIDKVITSIENREDRSIIEDAYNDNKNSKYENVYERDTEEKIVDILTFFLTETKEDVEKDRKADLYRESWKEAERR